MQPTWTNAAPTLPGNLFLQGGEGGGERGKMEFVAKRFGDERTHPHAVEHDAGEFA